MKRKVYLRVKPRNLTFVKMFVGRKYFSVVPEIFIIFQFCVFFSFEFFSYFLRISMFFIFFFQIFLYPNFFIFSIFRWNFHFCFLSNFPLPWISLFFNFSLKFSFFFFQIFIFPRFLIIFQFFSMIGLTFYFIFFPIFVYQHFFLKVCFFNREQNRVKKFRLIVHVKKSR